MRNSAADEADGAPPKVPRLHPLTAREIDEAPNIVETYPTFDEYLARHARVRDDYSERRYLAWRAKHRVDLPEGISRGQFDALVELIDALLPILDREPKRKPFRLKPGEKRVGNFVLKRLSDVRLVTRHRSRLDAIEDNPTRGAAKLALQLIGERLAADGGRLLMHAAFERTKSRAYWRLDSVWNGIGGWWS